MSIIVQYLVLRTVLLKSHQEISSPNAFAVSYSVPIPMGESFAMEDLLRLVQHGISANETSH